ELGRPDLALLFVHKPENRAAMDSQLTTLALTADSLRHLDMADASRKIGDAVARIGSYVTDEYTAAAAGRNADADSISSHHILPAINAAERELTTAEHDLRDRSSRLVAAAPEEPSAARNAAAVGLGVAATLALIIALVLWRSISRP